MIFADRSKVSVRLVDFGFAANHKEKGKLRTVCGSPAYMAPEILSGKPYHGPPGDVWALANFLYELLHSKPGEVSSPGRPRSRRGGCVQAARGLCIRHTVCVLAARAS